MKILTSHQIKEADLYTITHEPIASEALMERAGNAIVDKILEDFAEVHSFIVFCGPGNNGGDGLVIARVLNDAGKDVEVFVLNGAFSREFLINYKKINTHEIPLTSIDDESQLSGILFKDEAVLIDALFGNGITRPVEGLAAAVIKMINNEPNIKVAIDLPSGLSPDLSFQSNAGNTVLADLTYTIQLPKLAFMFAENNDFIGRFECVDIGLSEDFIEQTDTPYLYTDEKIVANLIRPRSTFSHKGTFGHAMIIAGSPGKIGAAIISGKATLRTGCGLLTACIPEQGIVPMHTSLPEAMVRERILTSERNDYSAFDAIGIGPGMGQSKGASDILFELLNLYHLPLVIDADGLNNLSDNPDWYRLLKSNIILTPHPGEFDRLTHVHSSGIERYHTQQHFSKKHQVTIVLKGYHTSVTTPSGLTYFNSTGNNGMATAGSGDALTGIITSLCAQGYAPENAAVLGVYLHGFAGDDGAERVSRTALIASDIIDGIGAFFKRFER